MNAASWARVEALFAEALDLAPGARAARLAAEADAAVRDEVASLLAAHGRRGAADRLERELRDLRREEGPRPGERVGPWLVLERIGRGGMGVVVAARDADGDPAGPVVALKVMPSLQALDPSARARFLHEARAAAMLEHPRIAAVHGMGETDDGRPFLVMPLHDGETLAARLARGALPPAAALDVAIAVGEGLAHAHARGVIHRDVKPSNILLGRDGAVRLLDFGVARIVDARITASGAVLGTVPYMSPEQASGARVGATTDLWALGLVLCEMVTGEPHHRDAETVAALTAIRSGVTPRVGARPGGAVVDPLLERLLAPDPAARFPDASHALAALRAARRAVAEPAAP